MATVTQKEIFFQYLLNERDRLENDVDSLRQALRYKPQIDAVDCLELSLAMERLNCFNDFIAHSVAIFKMSCPADTRVNLVNIDYTAYRRAAERLRREVSKKVKGE